jgi:hypothetical protein
MYGNEEKKLFNQNYVYIILLLHVLAFMETQCKDYIKNNHLYKYKYI